MKCFFVSDLIFRSRIKESLNGEVPFFAKNIDEVLQLENKPTEFYIDLSYKKADSIELIKILRESFPENTIVSFGSHVDTEKLALAKLAGSSQVMANSGFVKFLESNRIQQKGAGLLTLFVFGLIVWAGGWYLFRYVPIQYRFYELQSTMHSICRVSKELSEKELRIRLIDQMKDIGVPGDVESVVMDRNGESVRIQYEYGEKIIFHFFDKSYLIQKFHFSLNVSEEPQV